jgi:hypothetical protein
MGFYYSKDNKTFTSTLDMTPMTFPFETSKETNAAIIIQKWWKQIKDNIAKDNESEKNIHPLSTRHGIIGVILVALLLLNVGWAIIVRRYVKDEDSILTRSMWLNGHRAFGTLIVIFLVYNLYLGNKIYNERFLSN